MTNAAFIQVFVLIVLFFLLQFLFFLLFLPNAKEKLILCTIIIFEGIFIESIQALSRLCSSMTFCFNLIMILYLYLIKFFISLSLLHLISNSISILWWNLLASSIIQASSRWSFRFMIFIIKIKDIS